MDNRSAAVVGTGLIASGMATLFAANGYRVKLLGTRAESCERCRRSIEENFAELVEEGILQPAWVRDYLRNISFTTSCGDLGGESFVLEAVLENLEVKHAVYRALEEHCPPETVIASATSALSPDELARPLRRKERLIVAHPWNPAHLIPCVEVVRSADTSRETLDTVCRVMESLGREVVVLRRSIEGFIGNRLQHALYREALYLVEQGVATPRDIDRAVLSSFGPRFSSVGVLEYYDSCGLELQKGVQTYLYPTLCGAEGPQEPLLRALAEGKRGPASGAGIYEWDAEHRKEFRRRKSKPFFPCFTFRRPEES